MESTKVNQANQLYSLLLQDLALSRSRVVCTCMYITTGGDNEKDKYAHKSKNAKNQNERRVLFNYSSIIGTLLILLVPSVIYTYGVLRTIGSNHSVTQAMHVFKTINIYTYSKPFTLHTHPRAIIPLEYRSSKPAGPA